jgi:bla regulator protein BlaR1
MESIIFSTLLHSLWHGVLLAVLTALIVLLTTNANAKLRYNLFVGALVVFIAGVGITFCIELYNFVPSSSVNKVALGSSVFGDSVMQAQSAVTFTGPAVMDSLISYLNKYASSIVMVWFLIICAKSIRLLVDMQTIIQLRTSQVYQSGTVLAEKVQHLALQYGIKQKVEILQSGIIKMPMVLGHFKPLILVPLGLINGLTIEEVEAILSHEMAHIKRRDYLVNILQSLAEIIFFFNPAVLWVSNLIRIEREHCCDDLAVHNVETKIDYIKALVSCQEFASEIPAYVMAVNGGKSQLVHRVQRLISSRNQSLNKLEKLIIALVLISSVAITTAFSGKVTQAAAVVTSKKDKKVTAPEMQHQDNSDDIYNQMIRDGLAKASPELYCTLDEDAFVINGKKQPADIHKRYAKLYLKKGQKLSFRFEKDYKNNESHHVASVKTIARTDKKAAQVEAISKSVVASEAQSAAVAQAAQPAIAAQAAQSAAKAEIAASAGNARAAQPAVQEKTRSKDDMTKDLIAEGLVKDPTNLSYELDINALVVDGEKQAEEIHKKYMRKYLKHAKHKIAVSVNTN